MSRYIIDKSKLIENINIVKNKAGVEVIGVVKGNGYGFLRPAAYTVRVSAAVRAASASGFMCIPAS